MALCFFAHWLTAQTWSRQPGLKRKGFAGDASKPFLVLFKAQQAGREDRLPASSPMRHSTVTDLARLRGLSTSVPRAHAV
jgi:hypothetical protein